MLRGFYMEESLILLLWLHYRQRHVPDMCTCLPLSSRILAQAMLRNIHQIMQLEDVSEDDIIRCDKGAKMILSIIWGDGDGGVTPTHNLVM